MKVVSVPKILLSPIALPGMGRSIDVAGLSAVEVLQIRSALAQGELFVEFEEEPGQQIPVINVWANPHQAQVTLFIK